MILYRTTLYIDTTRVINLSGTNGADKTDFETNYKAKASSITALELGETRNAVELSYTDFAALELDWADVIYVENAQRYDIYWFEGGTSAQGITVSEPFKKLSYASEIKTLNKGGKNKISIKPRVLIENQNDETNSVQDLKAGSNTDIGQVFRLSPGINNISRVHLSIDANVTGGGAGSSTMIDDFESYADTTALRAAWVANDLTNTPNTLETTLFQEGAKAMKMASAGAQQKSKSDYFEKTLATAEDWSARTGIQFQWRQDGAWTCEIHLTDSAGGASKHTITVSTNNVYEFVKLNFSAFISVGSVPVDFSDIKKIKFFIKTAIASNQLYVDIIETFTDAAPGGGGTSVDLELRDFGSDATPTTLGTLVDTATFDLETGLKTYEIPFEVTGLNANKYYGLVLTNSTADEVTWKGKNGSNRYTSGWAFKSINDLDITATGSGDDFHFLLFATDKAIFNGMSMVTNGPTGLSSVSAYINDNSSGKGKTALFLGENFMDRKELHFPTRSQTGISVPMGQDELVFVEYADDGTSLATKIQATVDFTFINRPING